VGQDDSGFDFGLTALQNFGRSDAPGMARSQHLRQSLTLQLVRVVMLRPYMLTGTILFVLFLLLAAGVAQREYEFVLESDFQVSDVRQWALFYQTLDLGVFTKRFPYTLLDGQPIVTGLFSALIEAIASYVPTLATALPTGLARDQMATTIVNVLSYSGAGVLFYATMYQITKSVP